MARRFRSREGGKQEAVQTGAKSDVKQLAVQATGETAGYVIGEAGGMTTRAEGK